jgi:hypothetical protein
MNRDKMKFDPAISEFCEESNAAAVKEWAARLGCSEAAARILAEAWTEWQRPLFDAAWHGRAVMEIDIDSLRKIIGRKIDELLGGTQVPNALPITVQMRKDTLPHPLFVFSRTPQLHLPIVLSIQADGRIYCGEDYILPPYRIEISQGLPSKTTDKKELPPIKAEKVSSLRFGPHVIYWCDGGSSLAVVGQLHDGTRWYAAANWTSSHPQGVASTDWSKIHDAVEYGAWSTVPLSDGIYG